MTTTEQDTGEGAATRIIESVQDAEQSALEAVRKFVDVVDGVFPDVSDDGPRRKIIDSTFKMVEQLVGVSNQFAQKIVNVTESVLRERQSNAASPEDQSSAPSSAEE